MDIHIRLDDRIAAAAGGAIGAVGCAATAAILLRRKARVQAAGWALLGRPVAYRLHLHGTGIELAPWERSLVAECVIRDAPYDGIRIGPVEPRPDEGGSMIRDTMVTRSGCGFRFGPLDEDSQPEPEPDEDEIYSDPELLKAATEPLDGTDEPVFAHPLTLTVEVEADRPDGFAPDGFAVIKLNGRTIKKIKLHYSSDIGDRDALEQYAADWLASLGEEIIQLRDDVTQLEIRTNSGGN